MTTAPSIRPGPATHTRPTTSPPTSSRASGSSSKPLSHRRLCLVDGPVGIGKTTAVVEAARALGREAVYVNMFGTIRSATRWTPSGSP